MPNTETSAALQNTEEQLVSKLDGIEARMKAADSGHGFLLMISSPSRAQFEFEKYLREDLQWLIEVGKAAQAVLGNTTVGETKDFTYPRWVWERLHELFANAEVSHER